MKVFFVNPRLAFGGAIKTPKHADTVRALGITHIVNLRRLTNDHISQSPNLWLRFKDDYKPRPAWFYRRALKFFLQAMGQPEAKLFVMCRAGLHRSPSLAYFFIRLSGVNAVEAKQMVNGVRHRAKVIAVYKDSGENFLQRMEKKGKVTSLPRKSFGQSSSVSFLVSHQTEQPHLPG